MDHNREQFCRRLETTHESVRRLSRDFCDALGLTTFAYARVTNDGRVSWVTSNPDQDRFLLESSFLDEEPVVDTREALKEGAYLHFADRKFPGSETFYRERARLFQLDHGMVLVKHRKDYLETCCFSGLVVKKPLFNLFLNEKALFAAFMDHFSKSIDRKIASQLEEGINLCEIKRAYGNEKSASLDRERLLAICGYKAYLTLSSQEKRCLMLLKEGYSYALIGKKLKLSPRTVEHYLESVKNKLGLESRPELCLAAEVLINLGIH